MPGLCGVARRYSSGDIAVIRQLASRSVGKVLARQSARWNS